MYIHLIAKRQQVRDSSAVIDNSLLMPCFYVKLLLNFADTILEKRAITNINIKKSGITAILE